MKSRNFSISILIIVLLVLLSRSVFSSETYWPLGMTVGAVSGACIGAAAGYGLAPLCEENTSKCRWQIPILTGSASLVLGGGIGALVGDMFEKGNDSFSVIPVAYSDDRQTVVGFGIGGKF